MRFGYPNFHLDTARQRFGLWRYDIHVALRMDWCMLLCVVFARSIQIQIQFVSERLCICIQRHNMLSRVTIFTEKERNWFNSCYPVNWASLPIPYVKVGMRFQKVLIHLKRVTLIVQCRLDCAIYCSSHVQVIYKKFWQQLCHFHHIPCRWNV